MSAPAPRPLSTAGAATGRNLAPLVTRMWKVRVTGAHHVPLEGPVILAANHTAFLDGLLLAAASPRPVHVLATTRMWVAPLDRILASAAQIPLEHDSPDRTALRSALDVLGAGGVVGTFPEAHRGAGDVRHVRHGTAYLAMHSGAPVVPVAILGARPAGAGKDALPRWRSPIDVLVGEPVDIRVEGDPRRRAVLARSGERLRQALADHVAVAVQRTGQALPGPVPDTEHHTHDHRSDS